jgi:PAS domain S-box-containing protein
MAPTEREQRLQFLDLTKRDEQLLKALRPLFEKHIMAVVDDFYDHLMRFPELARLLRDHTTVDRLKQLQRDYLLRITEGRFDESYFADRLRLGQTHERVGLSPRWYLSSYNLYFKLLAPLIQQHHASDPLLAQETLVALEKTFTLDASLAMEAYIASDRFRHLQQLESLVRDSTDAIFMLDPDKKIRTWNHGAERMFGWTAGEIQGRPLRMLVPPELLEAGELERVDRELNAHGFFHFETVRMAKDGRRVQVDVTSSLLHDAQGNEIGRSAILRDITQRKRLEEAKLQSERLAVIGAMSAKLAHEIRNPLSSILLNLDLVRDEIESIAKTSEAPPDEARALLKSLDSEVRRIQRVTQEYLQFARLPRPQRELVLLHEVIEERLAFIQSLFDSAGVKLKTEFDKTVPPIHADEEQLWQAVLNLARNAVEAMPEGGTLTVGVSLDLDDTVLTIQDTGKGMTKEEAKSIFKPFFSTKPGGTGLGLPLTQQIIHEHGGRIECQTVEGKGTTFTIRLPRATKS